MKQAQEILAKHTKLHPNLLRNEITIISNHALKAMEEFALQFEDDNGRANYYEDKIDLLNRINVTDNKTIEELASKIVDLQSYLCETQHLISIARLEYIENVNDCDNIVDTLEKALTCDGKLESEYL
jgi:hypothetical protein